MPSTHACVAITASSDNVGTVNLRFEVPSLKLGLSIVLLVRVWVVFVATISPSASNHVGTVRLYDENESLNLGSITTGTINVLFLRLSVEVAVMYPSDVVANVAVLLGRVNV